MSRPVRAGTGMRLLRTAMFTAVCVVLSATGHTLASGHTVPLWTLMAGWAAVFAVVAPLAGRERGLPGIVAGLTVGQVGLHLLFSAGEMCVRRTTAHADSVLTLADRLLCAGHPGRLTPAAAARLLRQAGIDPAHALAQNAAGAAGAPAMPGMPGGSGSYGTPFAMAYSPSMLAGHLLAALAVGWLLRRGDAALWRLAELSADVVRGAFALVRVLVAGEPGDGRGTPPRPDGRCGHRYEPGPPRTALLRHSVDRRGPPFLALAA